MRRLSVNHTTSTAHRLTHYDGVCNNIHGHNMEWDIILHVEMPESRDAMALDFKDVKEVVDRYDHAVLLNEDDPILEVLQNDHEDANLGNGGQLPLREAKELAERMLGRVFWFEKDPTTELLSAEVANKYLEFPNVHHATVEVKETDKYGMSATRYDGEVNGTVEPPEDS